MLGKATQKLSKMHARRNPGLSIQSTASYSQLSPPVLSATSGAFLSPTVASRRGLLSRSPPASPNLPSLIPRHGKKPTQQNHTRLVKRILIGFCGTAFLLWLVLRQIYSDSQQAVSYTEDGEEWEMVGGSQLPKEPSAVAVQDVNGKMRWTVSIPQNLDFPLRPAQYQDICQHSRGTLPSGCLTTTRKISTTLMFKRLKRSHCCHPRRKQAGQRDSWRTSLL
jgi:hypothetical protein